MQGNATEPTARTLDMPATARPATKTILSTVTLSLLLTACASTPMPAWVPTGWSTAAPVTSAPVARPAPVTAPAARVTPATPVTPPGLPVIVATPPGPATQAAPYNAAVAARFPDPSTVYITPGLQAGRTTFTSASEIRGWLREQVTLATRRKDVLAALLPIGSSQQGEALEALILTHAAGTDPAALLAGGKPTVLLIGQQHGDEPAGAEALLLIARELSQGLLLPLLERINVIIVPRANPDGAASGQRTTANGLDMNRDHLLLNTPEAQALARLVRDYKPTVVVDAHEFTVVGRYLEKFGTVQKFDALLQYATTANMPEFLTKASEEWFRRPVLTALKAQSLSSEWYYTTSSDLADKKISMGGILPDTGRNVGGLKNTISLLVETRGVGIGRMHIQRRVHTHVTAISSVLASTAQRASELGQLMPYLDKEVSALACRNSAVVEAGATAAQYELTMLDPLSGADKTLIVDWDSALALRTLKARARPCGYWLSASSFKTVERLKMHGLQVQRIAEAGSMLADSYRETSRSTGPRQDVRGAIADGNSVTKVEVSLTRGLMDVPGGSYYVPLNQPLANLAMAALEPDTQSSYFANGLLENLGSAARVMSPPAVRLEDLP